jgi:carboxymethylenebutenolidase
MPDITSSNVTFPANGVDGSGYLAILADDAPHPGVIVIQEWWGLDGHIKDIAERFAREGFVALAPDLYHGAIATEPDEARKLVMNMNREQAVKDLLGAVKHLQSLPNVAPKQLGCIGFCMGGSLTLALAAATPAIAACAPFYAGMQPGRDQIARIEAELFCAFGAADAGIPMDNVRAFEDNLKSTGKTAEVKVYDGAPHSFFNDTKDSYRAAAANDAWSNSLALFRRVLAAPAGA